MLSLSPLQLGIWAQVGAIFCLQRGQWLTLVLPRGMKFSTGVSLCGPSATAQEQSLSRSTALSLGKPSFISLLQQEKKQLLCHRTIIGREGQQWGLSSLSCCHTLRAVRPSSNPCWTCWSVVMRQGICVVETGKEEKAQLSSSSCSKSCEVQVQDQCVQQAKDRALPRHAWVTTESTSAFLERAVAWQLKLRKAGLEIRCYF